MIMLNMDEIIKGKKILIVDDNEDTVVLYKRMLRPKGYTIIVARNGEDALVRAREENPHLILLDVGLPKLDGYDICEMLKSSEKTKMIAVIIVTCYSAMANKLRGYDKGADDYIIKPVNKDELLAKIHVLLKIKYLHEQLIEAEKLKTLAQVAVRVNHDINNPLCSILANGEMLRTSLEKKGNSPDDLKRIDLILEQIEKIKTVIEMLSKATKVISMDYIKGVQMLDLERSVQPYFESREYL
ncbi:MAG: response regulator [bacterium]